MKKLLSLLAAVCLLLTAQPVFAGEIDVLMNKLVEKGVLTPFEAQIVSDETKADVAKQIAQGKHDGLPSWIQKMQLKGDIRLRYQKNFDSKTDGDGNIIDRDRFRVRYRLGVIAKPSNQFEIAAGFATGGSDPRSTNETLDDVFSTKAINLDYAYAKYIPNGWFNVIAGKFKRKEYLWNPTDLLWDGDINPEGISVHADIDGPGVASMFLNAGAWILDEYSSGAGADTDPFLAYVQGGLSWKDGAFDAKVAATAYSFTGAGAGDAQLSFSEGGNTTSGGNLVYDYDSIGISGELGVKGKSVGLPFARLAIFGDYINNPDADEGDTGYAVGFKFGDKKVGKPGTWQAKYIYAKLEKDAWMDTFPDSDRFSGGTGIKSHEFAINYAIKNNVIFGLDYYNSEQIDDPSDTDELVQADLLFKF